MSIASLTESRLVQTTISITQFDIRDGRRCSACGCVIAIAGNRVLKPEYEWVQYIRTAYIRLRGTREFVETLQLPPEAAALATDYDTGKPVQPIEFQVSITEQYLRAA